MSTKQFTIHSSQLTVVEDKLTKLNRKAARLGIPQIVITNKREFEQKVDTINEAGRTVTLYIPRIELTIECETIKIGKFTFVAKLEHNEDMGNIVQAVPGETVPPVYFNADCNCDHCNIKRNRKDTFIFRDDSKFVQVGRTCLKEYFGIDPQKELEFAGAFSSFSNEFEDEDEGFGGSYNNDFKQSTEVALAVAMALADEYGYMSNTRARELECSSTSDDMNSVLYPSGGDAKEYSMKMWGKIEEGKYFDKAKEMLAWGQEYFQTQEENEYAHNIKTILGAESIRPKYFGYLASVIATYSRAMGDRREKIVSANTFIGEVKGKVTVDVLVNRIIPIPGQYGTTYTVIMTEKTQGNSVVWFASNPPLNEGDEVKLQGTVKEHNVRNNVNQTVLTRCKVIDEK